MDTPESSAVALVETPPPSVEESVGVEPANESTPTPTADAGDDDDTPPAREAPPDSSAHRVDNGGLVVDESFKRAVQAFYRRHNPSKVNEVDRILVLFQGKEHRLIQELEKKYNARVLPQPVGDGSAPVDAHALVQCRSELAKAQDQVAALARELGEARKEQAASKQRTTELERANRDNSDALSAVQAECAYYQSTLFTLLANSSSLINPYTALQSPEASLENLPAANPQHADLATVERRSSQLVSLVEESKLRKANDRIQSLQRDLDSARKEVALHSGSNDEFIAKLCAKDSVIEGLNAELLSLRATLEQTQQVRVSRC
jgi:hypothetical protein